MITEAVSKYSYINKSIPRIDSNDKVRGTLQFLTDIKLENALYAYTFRSKVAHGKINGIYTEDAEKVNGVKAVLTYKDIPALNGYGAIVPEIPVLAYDKVRYYGEPLALVAAETQEAAIEALGRIKADITPLPVVHSIDEALEENAPKIHDKGNIARHTIVRKGDVEKARSSAYIVLERVYETPMQKHMFLEPEGGVAYIDEEGVLNVLAGGQTPYRDKIQISRVLGIPPEKIRVKNTPTGGAFGGKDDITVQIHLALLAYKTKRPVKLVWSREESGVAGFHRTGSKIKLRTSANKDGALLSNEAIIYLDSGAYQSFGPTILDVSIETINGPYRIPNYIIDANLVYTNNGIASAFRGFGAPESNFAIESMMNELADELKIDPIEIRLKNILKSGEIGPFNNEIRHSKGLEEALNRAKELFYRLDPSGPFQRTGVGIAVSVKGVGFGTLPEFPAAAIEIIPEGKVRIMFSNVDYGQGINTGNAQLVAEKLQVPLSQIEVLHSDTKFAPDTGGSSASRSTFNGGGALLLACDKALSELKTEAASFFMTKSDSLSYKDGHFYYKDKSVSIYEVAKRLRVRGKSTRFEATFEVPRYSEAVEGTLEVPHMVYMYGVIITKVEVDELLGKVKPREVDFIADIGNVINPAIAAGQIEGGIIQGLGYSLIEELNYDKDGRPLNINYTTYPVPIIADSPLINVEFIRSYEELGPFGAKGVGEVSIIPVGASVADAVADAIGKRNYKLPLLPWKIV
ncbi:MAG: xanthine dehydrogenase family protein molybdopterin-binding subunit [Nitrososphaeria archaeon]|nr:xanthine dehydrogenase family protein molybdopterin-binding subunit [Conexivisphaerales archaeon]